MVNKHTCAPASHPGVADLEMKWRSSFCPFTNGGRGEAEAELRWFV